MFTKRFEELSSSLYNCIYTAHNKKISEEDALKLAFRMLGYTVFQKGIVYVIGNGGSAGIASHFSNDLMKALQISAQTLFDSNLMTCLANDIGYENVFSYPLEILLKPHDLLIAISSSGKSPNILRAAEVALACKTPLITLSGFQESNPLRVLGHLNFWIDRCDYGLVETAHFFLLHTVVDLWHKNKPQVAEYAQLFKSAHAS